MISFSTESMIVLSICCLVLNWFAFRADAEQAGHDRKQMLKMAAIWVTIIVAVAFAFSVVGG